jgi:hypothetical protein
VKHLVPDMQRGQKSVNIILADHQKVLEGVMMAVPEQQTKIESLKLCLSYLHNRVESMNTGPSEQKEEPNLVQNASEVETLEIEKRLDEFDRLVKHIARSASP